MILYKPVTLPFSPMLAEHTLLQTENLVSEDIYVKNISIPDDLRNQINEYLNSKGVSNLFNILAFKRRNAPPNSIITHVDCSGETIINCSVVIPVAGCKNTAQYWYSGPYDLKFIRSAGYVYSKIIWKGIPEYLGKAEICDSPMLVKTDMPHNAISNGPEYRTTCTIRFKDNESFEYLSERLSA